MIVETLKILSFERCAKNERDGGRADGADGARTANRHPTDGQTSGRDGNHQDRKIAS